METKNQNNEEWKPIEGYEGLYEISNCGRVKSIDYQGHKRELILKPSKRPNYYSVNLCKDGFHKSCYIHRLVAAAFIPNPNNLPCVNHKNENCLDNRAENLEWCTYKYNSNYGTAKQRQSEKIKGKLNGKQSKPIRCVETNIVYPSAAEAGRQLNIYKCCITKCCRGQNKTYKGYHWEYVA